MTSEPRLHSAAFSDADRVLAARIRERDDRIAKLEARVWDGQQQPPASAA